MRRAIEDAVTRSLTLLTVAVLLGLATVLPALFATDSPAAAATAVLALALAALLVIALCQVRGTAALHPVACATGNGPPPVLTGRVTDPVHHPVRPRAPATA